MSDTIRRIVEYLRNCWEGNAGNCKVYACAELIIVSNTDGDLVAANEGFCVCKRLLQKFIRMDL